MHISLLASVRAGKLFMSTVGFPGTHGATVTGTQGIGVSTPRAAAVAAATAGLLGVVHMPKGGIFTIGIKSMMVAAGVVAKTIFTGSTIREEGATPKLHVITAPLVTRNPM